MRLSSLAVAVLTLAISHNAAATLINGGFEDPDLGSAATFALLAPASVPGWNTTDTRIEIWANGFGGVTSFEGTQHAEINAFINGTLFQDVAGIGSGSLIGFEFAHRARSGTDVMRLTITDLGPGGSLGGGDDTTLFTDLFSADTSAWVFHSSGAGDVLAAVGNTVRFAYTAVSTGSGSPSVGNFLDAADFGVGVGGTVPEPTSLLLLGLGLAGLGFARKRLH
jgi:hypothetical protein